MGLTRVVACRYAYEVVKQLLSIASDNTALGAFLHTLGAPSKMGGPHPPRAFFDWATHFMQEYEHDQHGMGSAERRNSAQLTVGVMQAFLATDRETAMAKAPAQQRLTLWREQIGTVMLAIEETRVEGKPLLLTVVATNTEDCQVMMQIAGPKAPAHERVYGLPSDFPFNCPVPSRTERFEALVCWHKHDPSSGWGCVELDWNARRDVMQQYHNGYPTQTPWMRQEAAELAAAQAAMTCDDSSSSDQIDR